MINEYICIHDMYMHMYMYIYMLYVYVYMPKMSASTWALGLQDGWGLRPCHHRVLARRPALSGHLRPGGRKEGHHHRGREGQGLRPGPAIWCRFLKKI